MAQNILVAVAWPYANGPFHVGHLAGAYLPADIFARYQRLKGNRVLMVSGSDCHGTPITLKAETEGVTPQEVIRRYHRLFLNTFQRLGITFDLFTQTYTPNHYAVTTDFFLKLLDRGYIYTGKMMGSYSESLRRFLPDRFVEGVCPNCGFDSARGDQCDNCGKLREPSDLINPRSKLDGERVTFRETEHFFLDLARIEPELTRWLSESDHSHWRPNVLAFTENWLRDGLHSRAITRDLEWGVPVPVESENFKDKRIYVWFDAVIGYLSASMERATRVNAPEIWREWWENPAARSYYFIGKDNIPFHSIIWPAMLIGYGGRILPYDILANEFLNLEGEKMSTSRNWALWAHDIEQRYAPDTLRYYLAANAPESRDSNWSWRDFVRRNNDELVANWGNLANRVLNIAYREFRSVPQPHQFLEPDQELIATAQGSFDSISSHFDAVRLKTALQETLALAQQVNRYITKQEPWKLVKTDRARAATVLYTGLQTVEILKTLFSPFLPFSSQTLHETLGFSGILSPLPAIDSVADLDGQERTVLTGNYQSDARWMPHQMPIGQPLREPKPLFTKLEASIAEAEIERLWNARPELS
jgi:methionyl-tRNA synthetase